MRRLTLVIGLLLALDCSTARAATSATVTLRGDGTHDNRVTGAPEPPLGVQWAAQLGADVSYPVVADGSVFVTVRPSDAGPYGTEVVALDATTGNVRWRRPESGSYYWSALTYDQGRLAVVNGDGRVTAIAPATGATVWSTQLDQYSFSTPPVADAGHVYLVGGGSGETVYALRMSDGAVEWQRDLPSGAGTPAVDADRVYVSMSCQHAVALSRATGGLLWERHGSCSGGGEASAALHGTRMYPLGDNGAIYDRATGETVGAANFQGAVAFADGTAYVPWLRGILASDAASWVTRWQTPGDAETGANGEAPLISAGHLYVGSEAGYVAALRRSDGAVTWCASTAGQPVQTATGNVDRPDSGLGAGNGMLFVPAGGFLVAYGPGGATPAPCAGAGAGTGGPSQNGPAPLGPALTLRAAKENITAGQRAQLTGRLTRTAAGVAGVPVIVQADRWPFGGRWKVVGRPVSASDGTFRFRHGAPRNTRYRALAAGLTSPTATVYAELAARVRRRILGARRFQETWTISGPRSVRLGVRRAHFYVVRAGRRTARLEASPLLRRPRPGVYTTSARLRFLKPRSKTRVIACYREATPDPWGRPSPLDPRCGRRRLTLPAAAPRAAAATGDATWRFTAGH